MADYGTGADGALNFNGTTAVLGISPTTVGAFKVYFWSGANINASSASIASGVVVAMQQWKFYCTGAITGAGSGVSFIHCNGPDAPTAIANGGIVNATALPAGFYDVGAPGNSGSSGSVVNAIPSPNTTTGHANAGTSAGGIATSGADGPSAMKGGGGGAIWNANQQLVGVVGGDHTALTSSTGYTPADQIAGFPADNPTVKYRWGSGGGQGVAGAIGAGGGTNPTGGGGGGGGGCLLVSAFSISNVRLQANGGRGGDGAAGTIGTGNAGSGGGGGGGGVVIFYYGSKSGVVVEALGGARGLAATAGTGCVGSTGGAGAAGWVYSYDGSAVTGGTPGTVYWGPHFPDAAGNGTYWGPHFPDGKISTTSTPPSTVGGVATLLLLEAGSKLELSYGEDTINQKMWAGAERRQSMLDDPKRTFVGQATLIGDSVRLNRAALARFAAVGAPFSLAVPFEAISITGPASGNTLPTSPTTSSDWMQLGQRVTLTDQSGGGTSLDAVIQGFTANSVTLDKDPSAFGHTGCLLMPTVPVYLDPSMQFVRSRGTKTYEQWQLNARAAVFGYPVAQNYAFASLSAATGVLAAGTVSWAVAGAVGNAVSLTLVGDSALSGGSVTNVGNAYTFHFKPGVTSVLAMQINLDLGPAYFNFTGVDPSAVLIAGDAIGPLALHGGTDAGYGTPGVGATVATYDGRPLWDRHVQVSDTAADSIQSLAELLDLGGIPISIGTATQPDWGRALLVKRELGAEFQWIKAFLAAVRGCQRAFWLSSYRQDLTGASWSGANLVIAGPSDAAGGLNAWWPLQRDRIEIKQADGNLVLAKITAAVDNHDGTMTLTLGTLQGTATGAAITRVSWLELCRFDSPKFTFTFSGGTFELPTTARVVQA